jgi:formate hydrogenlyase subunit 6/NADH:ubiquinone oxidoreductase subunit I
MSYRISEACNGCGACVKLCPVGAVTGEKKNLHLINSLLCIECGACGRICPVIAVRDPFGIVCERIKRSAWKKPQIDLKTCMPCGICIDACPVNCLAHGEPVLKKELHSYPFLKEDKWCIGCGFCSLECPVHAIKMIPPSIITD